MQIIPTSNKSGSQLPFEFLANTKATGTGSDLFSDLLFSSSNLGSNLSQEGFSTLPAILPDASRTVETARSGGETQQVPTAAASTGASARKADTLRDTKVTQEEYAAMSEKLEAAGVPEEKVEELQKQVQSPEGLTWGQLMHGVREAVINKQVGAEKLSEADKANVESLLGKLGFSQEQTKGLMNALASGNSRQVFKKIGEKLAAMEPGQTVSISKDDMASLGRALKLTESSVAKLTALFGDQDSLELTAAAAGKLLNVAGQESSAQMASLGQSLKKVKDVVDQVLDKAKERKGLERQAAEDAADPKLRPSQYLAEPREVGTVTKEQPDTGKNAVSQDARQGHDAKDPRQQGADLAGKDGSQRQKEHQPQAQTQAQAQATLASKVKVEGDAGSTPDTRFTLAQGMNQALQGQQAGKGAEAGQAARAQSTQIMNQVESGILRNLGQGMKQLTLELTPDTLGRLNVVLTVKGKEVQAVIKPESPQAEKMIAENLQQIKQSLENQGLTVSKLEVRAGLSQDSNLGQQWAGADKHNQQQERRETLERMRTQSLLANDGVDVGLLARQMQDTGVRVKNSQGGLDLVA